MKKSDWKYVEEVEVLIERYYSGDLDATDVLENIRDLLQEAGLI